MPLRWRGRTQSVAFVLGEDGLPRSGTVFLCGSIPMVGQDWERCVPLDSGDLVRLYWDADQDISPSRLSGSIAYWPAPGSTRTRCPPAEDVRDAEQISGSIGQFPAPAPIPASEASTRETPFSTATTEFATASEVLVRVDDSITRLR